MTPNKVVLYELTSDLDLESAKAVVLPIMMDIARNAGAHMTGQLAAERRDGAWRFSMETVTLYAPV